MEICFTNALQVRTSTNNFKRTSDESIASCCICYSRVYSIKKQL